MRIRLSVPEAHVGPDVLDSALEAVTRTNESLLRAGVVPHADEAIAAGVKWRPEPPGDEHFDPATTVLARGWGDCDDLAPYKAASLRVTGEDPGAFARVIPAPGATGPGQYHAVVERSDGTHDDPSADAGMYDYRPPIQPMMHPGSDRPHLAWKVVGAYHVARCDVPWQGTRMAISGHGWGHSFDEAASEAVMGAVCVGENSGAISPDHAQRLLALNALLGNADPREVEAVLNAWGHPHAASVVGGIVGALHPVKRVVATTLAGYVGADETFAHLVRHLTDIATAHGVPPAEAHAHAEQAARAAMQHHGQVSGHVVGSLFGSILKTATSMLPIPGAGLISNMLPDINPFGGGGGHAAPGAPAPHPAAPAYPGAPASPGAPGAPPHQPPVVIPIITRF